MPKLHYNEIPSDKEKKKFAPFLSEDEELVLVTGLGDAYLRQRFIIQIVLPFGFLIILAVVTSFIFREKISPNDDSSWLGYGLLLGLLLAGVASFIKTVHTNHAHKYLLTTRRVIVKKGLFAVKLVSAMYDKITRIEVDQGFIDKLIYHHGTIIINTAGMTQHEIILRHVDYPVELKNLLERMINREREHFGTRGGVVTPIEGEVI